MANPLSGLGWSDRDYAAAVGTLAGEAAARGTLVDYQAIADVIANRASAGVYGKSIAEITMNPSQFSAWSPKEKSAFANAKAGFAAALNPTRAAQLSPAVRDRVEKAQQALNDVMATGKARGITQGATAYHNAEVTAKLGTGSWHKGLESKYGSLTIGAHTFTGPGFQPNQTFDPITYNGQLAAPPAAETFFGDLGAPPTGVVEFAGDLPDLTPASAGFSLAGATLPDDFSLDFSPGLLDGPVDFSGVGSLAPVGAFSDQALGQPQGFTSPEASALFSGPAIGQTQTFDAGWTPGFEGFNAPGMIDQASFDARFSGVSPDQAISTAPPQADLSISPVGALGMGETFGIQSEAWGPGTGFAAGVDAGPYGHTPDFNAPSLDARNAMDRFEGVMSVRNNTPIDMTREAIAASVMAELGQPALAATPLNAQPTQAPAMASPPQAATAPSASLPAMGDAITITPAPTVAAVTHELPASTSPVATAPTSPTAPAQQQDEGFSLGPFGWGKDGLTIGGFSNPMDAVKSGFGLDGVNASGFMDGPIGRGLSGAAMGGMFGGVPGAALGAALGASGWGTTMSNQIDNFFGGMIDHALQGWDSYDFATHGYGPGFNARGERSHTGMDKSGNATMGDGSFSDQAGFNDNNPQGIL